ncbi:MAG: urea ABC transporter permease subunit UrtC [Geminicoccaceae bacterium]|nr:urea ABC transporter permease subunit UrtC [Geminicoccaceae bacterium]MCX8100813.1 urea ABC transporter permease subunit UrtC [Geminicoccaceae bacterium]MDW8370675.1 urea ABC transporter permease subunit UrtC [Geminicoccaceae bacterium]
MVRSGLGRPALLLLLVACAILLVPVLNRLVPEGSAFHLEDRLVPLFGKYLAYAVLAVSLDLVWGRAGILSLGHGAFFALGGYAMGMYLMRQIGPRGVYAHPVLPDFMVFLNWQELPWYWYGFDRFWFALSMVVLVPGTLAFLFGWLAFRSRVSGVYLSIITQALTFALMLAFFRNDMGFGGNNGLTDFKDILGFPIASPDTRLALYLATGVLLLLALAVAIHLRRSPLGRLLVAIRDGEPRARFLGHDTLGAKLFVWTLSGVLAGLAGALYVPQVGIINPSEFSPAASIEIAIWVAVGGRDTILGPVLGALLVNGMKTWLTGAAPELWLFVLGGLFVLVTLVLPSGLAGIASGLGRRPRAAAKTAREAEPAPRPVEAAHG